jgi:hypothetical protein
LEGRQDATVGLLFFLVCAEELLLFFVESVNILGVNIDRQVEGDGLRPKRSGRRSGLSGGDVHG